MQCLLFTSCDILDLPGRRLRLVLDKHMKQQKKLWPIYLVKLITNVFVLPRGSPRSARTQGVKLKLITNVFVLPQPHGRPRTQGVKFFSPQTPGWNLKFSERGWLPYWPSMCLGVWCSVEDNEAWCESSWLWLDCVCMRECRSKVKQIQQLLSQNPSFGLRDTTTKPATLQAADTLTKSKSVKRPSQEVGQWCFLKHGPDSQSLSYDIIS